MWLRFSHYQHLFSALSEARATILSLERANAHHTTTIDWLTTHVNRLEHERSILTSERLRVLYPTPEIRRVGHDPAVRGLLDPLGAKTAHEAVQVEHGLPDDSVPMAQALGALLEDVGDEAASRMGITHDDETGQLRYT